MKWFVNYVSLVVILGVGFAGCSQQDHPVEVEYPQGNSSFAPRTLDQISVATSESINGYLVQFDGRVYADNRTTFSYTVTGSGAEHALSHFALELPECAPAVDSFNPAGALFGVNPATGIFGIKWEISLEANESRSYSITFPGDVPLGVIRATVKAGTVAETGEVAGPCGGFTISGTVYVDADSNGVMNGADEAGIPDVTVSLVDGKGNVQESMTDVNGDYAFLKTPGTYTLRIDAATPAIDFNEELAESFDPTGPTTATVTVGPDSPENDFGFDPKAKQIIYEFEEGVLLTNGESAKFWTKQVRAAMSGGKGSAEYDAATMAQFLTEIQDLFLPDPFQFTPGNEFQEAMDILSSNSKDPLERLLKELLAAEFNEVSGKGIIDASDLQNVLLAWAESLVAQASSGATSALKYSEGPQLAPPLGGSTYEDAIVLLGWMNGSTGGGSGGGG